MTLCILIYNSIFFRYEFKNILLKNYTLKYNRNIIKYFQY